MPPALERAWHTHGYYGSVSHNVKAIYQRYLGWFDGNPAHLWQHPPEAAPRRYVECMGGADAVVAKAEAYRDDGDLRFAAELLDRRCSPIRATPGPRAVGRGLRPARLRIRERHVAQFLPDGAHELRHGIIESPPTTGSAELLAALSVEQLFDAIAIRIDGPRAWDEVLTVDWRFTDLDTVHRMTLRNGVLTHRRTDGGPTADLALTLTSDQLVALVTSRRFDGIGHDGDVEVLLRLLAVLDAPDTQFRHGDPMSRGPDRFSR